MIVVDSNVLIGAIQTFDPALRTTARNAVKSLYRQGEQLLCFPQNLVEFWSASTRPADANGLGFTPGQAAHSVSRFLTLLRLLPETPDIFSAWRNLVLRQRVSGVQVHDARIVAAMMVYKVSKILTFDRDDFKRYDEITVIHPNSLQLSR